MEKLINFLDKRAIEYKKDMPLAPFSTFKIGGNCAVAVFPKNKEELVNSIRESKANGIKCAVIGKGSNVLFSDDGYDGILIFTSHQA